MDGFILLHRKIQESWLWQRPEYLHWFIYMLFKANFKDNDKFLFEGEFITIKRGEFVTSYRNLAKELTKCTEQKLKTFLNLCKKSGAIELKSLKKATQITICNYDSYQNPQHNSNTVATQQQHSSNTVATSIERKIKKEERKIKKEYISKIEISKEFYQNEIVKMNGESETKLGKNYIQFTEFMQGKNSEEMIYSNCLNLQTQVNFNSFKSLVKKATENNFKLLDKLKIIENNTKYTKNRKSLSLILHNFLTPKPYNND